MNISITIPVYNESAKIVRDIKAAEEFLKKNDLSGEILVVDDGSSDNTSEIAGSAEVLRETVLKVIRYEPHMGKGYAVRKGIASAEGEYIAFIDSGSCIPLDYLKTGLEIIRKNTAEIAHGSRRLPESRILKKKSFLRRIIPKYLRWVFIKWLGVSSELTDTQCGFKIYKGNVARELYGECLTDGFLFDVEIILRAQKHGYRIKEFPVEWTADPDSRL
ncbi:glycosyltransferase, partial [candidate division KSB1 bacterium]